MGQQADGSTDRQRKPLPWGQLARLAALGTLLMVAGVLVDLSARGDSLLGLIQPGADGPSTDAFREDFPDVELPQGIGHDGQQFYAVAREPMHVDQVVEQLDRPRYRLQRPLFPAMAWMLHPFGGGNGLIVALFAVGAVALFVAGLMGGALAVQLGGGAWPALVIPLLPGSYAALRLTLADTLALGLALAALLAIERKRLPHGASAAVLAVLAKEAVLVILVAHAVWRRSRGAVVAAIASSTATAGLWFVLRLTVDSDAPQVVEFTWPFGGFAESMGPWLRGEDLVAAGMAVGTVALTVAALISRGPRHPLFGAVAGFAAFVALLGRDVVGLDFNGTRTLGPLLVLSILMLGTPTGDRAGCRSSEAQPASSYGGLRAG